MNEADVRREVYHSLQGYGYWPLHGRDAIICPHCGWKVTPAVAGRPDLLILDPVSCTKVMEVKVVDISKSLSFAFSQLEPDQRRWIEAWYQHEGLAYLTIGTINESPRRIWVIPWVVWRSVESIEQEQEGHTCMPVDLSLYKKIPDKTMVVSLESEAFRPFKLVRVLGKKIEGEKFSGPHWEFPEDHSLIEGKVKLWTQTPAPDGQ